MKNKAWIRIGIIVVLLIVGFFIYKATSDNTKESEKEVVKSEPIAYEILDQSVELENDVDKWVEENLDEEGFFTKKTDKETYLLISGGKQKTTGYGISLNAVKQENQTINVQYEVIAPSKSDEVEKKETQPHMILRFDSKDAKVKGKIAPLESATNTETKEEGK